MPLASEVKLPKDLVPEWPDRCVACDTDSPNHSIKLGTNTITAFSTLSMSFGDKFRARVPVCRGCAWRLRSRRIIYLILIVACMYVGFHVAPHLIGDYQGFLRTPLFFVIALGACIPVFVWSIFSPPAIDLTAFKETVDYEFRSEAYAHDFAELNGGEAT